MIIALGCDHIVTDEKTYLHDRLSRRQDTRSSTLEPTATHVRITRFMARPLARPLLPDVLTSV